MEAGVKKQDRQTVEHLEAAADSIIAALETMPNNVASVFDPASDCPRLSGALESIRLITMAAEAQL